MGTGVNTNRKYKSSVFASYFSDAEKLIETYNAIGGKSYPADTEVVINTLEDALFMERVNDVSFLLGGKLVVLLEHQGSPSKNLPLRMLLYVGRLYEKILDRDNVYRQNLVRIPKPDFIVLYNGDDELPDRTRLNLSEAFEDADVPGFLELTVNVYNVNEGRNGEILRRGKSLGEYAAFIGRVKGNRAKGLPLDEAITEAVEHCIDKNVMREYLERNSSEVRNMLFTEFNIDDAKRVWREEALIEGMEKGIEQNARRNAAAALAKGLSARDVADITGLDVETVKKLKSEALM